MDAELVAVVKEQMARVRDLAETMDHKGTRKVLFQIADRLSMVVLADRGVTVPTDEEA
jgi:hypothetical protein